MISKMLCKLGFHRWPTKVTLFNLDGKQVAEVRCSDCYTKSRVEIVQGFDLVTWEDKFFADYMRVTPFSSFDDAA